MILDEILKMCDKATPGPWSFELRFNEGDVPTITHGEPDEFGERDSITDEDYQFAALARDLLPTLAKRLADLERQLEHAQRDRDLTYKCNAQLTEQLAESRVELDRLREWKKSAMAVEQEWDEQAIAKLLGATLGESCRKVINERIPQLIAELAEARAECERLRAEQIIEREEWNVFAGIRRPPSAPALTPKDARLLRAILEPVDYTGPDEP